MSPWIDHTLFSMALAVLGLTYQCLPRQKYLKGGSNLVKGNKQHEQHWESLLCVGKYLSLPGRLTLLNLGLKTLAWRRYMPVSSTTQTPRAFV